MTKSKRKKRDKYAKHKVVAIPVLLAVLGFVLWDGEEESRPTTQVSKDAPPTEVGSAGESIGEGAVAEWEQIPWPKPNLAFLNGANPFASYLVEEQEEEPTDPEMPPTELLVSKKEEAVDVEKLLREVAAELTRQSDSFAFSSSRRKVIVTGGREFTVGDEIRDGVFLKSIRGDRVELEYRQRTSQID